MPKSSVCGNDVEAECGPDSVKTQLINGIPVEMSDVKAGLSREARFYALKELARRAGVTAEA